MIFSCFLFIVNFLTENLWQNILFKNIFHKMAKIPRNKIHWTVVELNVSIIRNIRSILLIYFAYVRAMWVDERDWVYTVW